MKTVFAALLLTLFLAHCRSSASLNSVSSVTTIPAGREFELGGNGNGAFSVQVLNLGPDPVTVSQRQSDGQVTPLGQLRPGNRQPLSFVAGSVAVFANASARSVDLDLRLAGDTNLRMGYAREKIRM